MIARIDSEKILLKNSNREDRKFSSSEDIDLVALTSIAALGSWLYPKMHDKFCSANGLLSGGAWMSGLACFSGVIGKTAMHVSFAGLSALIAIRSTINVIGGIADRLESHHTKQPIADNKNVREDRNGKIALSIGCLALSAFSFYNYYTFSNSDMCRNQSSYSAASIGCGMGKIAVGLTVISFLALSTALSAIICVQRNSKDPIRPLCQIPTAQGCRLAADTRAAAFEHAPLFACPTPKGG